MNTWILMTQIASGSQPYIVNTEGKKDSEKVEIIAEIKVRRTEIELFKMVSWHLQR